MPASSAGDYSYLPHTDFTHEKLPEKSHYLKIEVPSSSEGTSTEVSWVELDWIDTE